LEEEKSDIENGKFTAEMGWKVVSEDDTGN